MARLTAPGALFDSSILIDALGGHSGAVDAIDASGADRAVSIVTWIEVMAGPIAGEEDARELLSTFTLHQLSSEVAEAAALIRRGRRLKLPDAVILATARVHGRTLVTRDARAFAREPLAHFPYQL